LNSLFIFAAVTLVSMDNNRARIDRLIEYRFDFISRYFLAELENIRGAQATGETEAINSEIFGDLFDRSCGFMKGLAGLSLLVSSDDRRAYNIMDISYRGSMEEIIPGEKARIVAEADREIIQSRGIQIGDKVAGEVGELKTIYIPWETDNPENVLAITFLPDEITGGDYQYNYTLILLFLIITLITLLIINLLFRKFIKPLKHLIRGMERTAEGRVSYRIEGVPGNEIGRVANAFNSMVDALWTKRKELTRTLDQLSYANKSLAESEAFLSELVRESPFAIIVTDPDHKILIFSKAAALIFDIKQDEALGGDFRRFFPFTPEKVYPRDEESNKTAEDEMICAKSNGDSFPALVSRVPIRDESSVVRAYLFIIRDISESKGFQEMMISIDRMATRGVMAGEMIAHEINNYLAVILGNVELLPLFLARGDMDKVEKKLEVLKNSVARIQRFSEGLAGDINEEAVIESADLNQLIENLVAFLKPQNYYDGIRFKLDLSQKLPLVYIDRGQVQQMLTNLLSNAAGALQEKPDNKEICVSTGVGDNGEIVRITVGDNAGGLPEDLEKAIFNQRYTGKRRGRGFGLMIVKRIVDRHGGDIEYESRPGDGTTFIVKIPVKSKTPAEETATASSQVNS
jgi:PAS domain S-box-containing protein